MIFFLTRERFSYLNERVQLISGKFNENRHVAITDNRLYELKFLISRNLNSMEKIRHQFFSTKINTRRK